jgi:putative FmdB family regulatory protein
MRFYEEPMPIYEYRCSDCGHQQEFLQKVSDAPLTVCTKCGKPSFSKMVTAAGFQLKGSGWYATDFKNSGSKPQAKETKSESASGDAKSDGGEKKAGPSCGAGGCPACA